MNRPPKPKYAKVEWKWIEDPMRETLKKDETVRDAYIAWRKECKGVTMGTVSKKCVKADGTLSRVITDYVAGGGELAAPEELPE